MCCCCPLAHPFPGAYPYPPRLYAQETPNACVSVLTDPILIIWIESCATKDWGFPSSKPCRCAAADVVGCCRVGEMHSIELNENSWPIAMDDIDVARYADARVQAHKNADCNVAAVVRLLHIWSDTVCTRIHPRNISNFLFDTQSYRLPNGRRARSRMLI